MSDIVNGAAKGQSDFWGGLSNWWGDLTGKNATDAAKRSQATGATGVATGQNIMEGAAGGASQSIYDAQKLAKRGAGQFAQESGQAGAALGEQMGRTAATQGTQAATQAARTQGVNKGQSALLGSQQAGNLFTQGQTQGQQLGMGAYGQGAQTQLGAVNAGTSAAATQGAIGANQAQAGIGQMNVGQGQANQGQQQGQDFWGGIAKIGGAALGLGDGAIVTEPTAAIVGEKGPEAVIPLSDMEKVKEILKAVYASSKKKKEKANA
jgi:hypothetical protein